MHKKSHLRCKIRSGSIATAADAIPKVIGLLLFQGFKDAVTGVPKELAERLL
jgi:hypothetical protein